MVLVQSRQFGTGARFCFELSQKSSKMGYQGTRTKINTRKISCIPPLFHNDQFMTNFFAKQCYLINTNNVLPKKAHELLSRIHLTGENIMKIIKSLDTNKVHDHGIINIRMIKICDASIWKPLESLNL